MSTEEWFAEDDPVVRPYAMTGGRTRPLDDALEMESLVSTTSLGEACVLTLPVEQQSIVLLCRDVLSVAEVSSRLDLPLGVARVIVGDMADDGLVAVHRPADPSERTDMALLERVLFGLRAI
jgi:Protein of unknown function (DUF742)